MMNWIASQARWSGAPRATPRRGSEIEPLPLEWLAAA